MHPPESMKDGPTKDRSHARSDGEISARRVAAIRGDVAATCDRIGETWGEIRARLQPAAIVRDLLQTVRSVGDGGGRPFARRMARTLRARPVPAMLLGTGAVMWMVQRNRSRSRVDAMREEEERLLQKGTVHGIDVVDRGPSLLQRIARPFSRGAHEAGDQLASLRRGAEHAADRVREEAEDVVKKARKVGSDAVNRISDLAEDAREKAREIGEKASEVASEAKTRAAVAASTGKRKARESYERYPIGMGLAALGAGLALGLLLPTTRKENEVVGKISDRLKDKATSAGKDLLRTGREVTRATASDDDLDDAI